MKIAISIVSFNTKSLLKNCLEDLINQKTEPRIEIWVLDNNSDDGSAQMVEDNFKKVHLIKKDQNVGFAKGQNIILREVLKIKEIEFVMLLNADTKLEVDTIDKMTDFMQKNSECGISSCKIVGYDGSLQSNGGDLPFGLALISWIFNLEILGNLPNFHRQESGYYKNLHQVGWVGGTLMMIKREVLEKVGLLNEDYFMYFEDVEFCFKAKKAGFKIMINPEVEIKHVGGASSKDPRFRQWSGEFRGLLYFYQKQYGFLVYLILKAVIYLSIILRIIVLSLMGKFSFAKTYGKVFITI